MGRSPRIQYNQITAKMKYGIILSQEYDEMHEKAASMAIIQFTGVMAIAVIFGIIIAIIALKSGDSGNGASYYRQAEKPAQMRVYGERNHLDETDYYRALWLTNTFIGD
jgi:hypothetical protein